jgi:hypothetical protein
MRQRYPLAFIKIQEPEGKEWSIDFNNKQRLEKVKILKTLNLNYYQPIILTNKTHFIFNMIGPAREIIRQLGNILRCKEHR